MEAKRLTTNPITPAGFTLLALLVFTSGFQQQAIDKLHNFERLVLNSVVGPESLAFDHLGGGPYTGVSDGRILKWQGQGLGWADFAVNSKHRDYLLAVITGDATGRLMKYDPETKKVTVLIRGLAFPNGLAISNDNTFLLIAETSTCRVLKYWLQGPRTGTIKVFAELPGYPDNIKRNPRGEFWVALNQNKLQLNGQTAPEQHPVALRLSQEGKVLEVLVGGAMTSISEVEENDGTIWFGSVDMPYVGVYKL
ncbi:Calcium-dependent phosphotriesterase superfamily protein isoform 2 [Cocos nucifera]|uniref:Calcium-dependent phosphotriesterase superfamily protein isoform 2 n=1 Tax=Cocos nucifera TaxID=13894 RepID=A0A8K0HVX7_COCNU|nr:Calcium-dependent phosphotriesterase superfamily protein isoform 2 [Cocos nucifera]